MSGPVPDDSPAAAHKRYLNRVEETDPAFMARLDRIERRRRARPLSPWALAPYGIALVIVLAGFAWLMGWTER